MKHKDRKKLRSLRLRNPDDVINGSNESWHDFLNSLFVNQYTERGWNAFSRVSGFDIARNPKWNFGLSDLLSV